MSFEGVTAVSLCVAGYLIWRLIDRVERLEKAVRWLSKGALYPEHEKGERREDER